MGGRDLNKVDKKIKKPYQYEVSEALEGINKKGKYCNSKHPNAGAMRFIKSNRLTRTKDNGVPGPGSYENPLSMSKSNNQESRGNFTLASYLNPRTTDFGKYGERF